MTEVALAPPAAMPEYCVLPEELTYPKGYFDVQVQFAQRWSEVTGDDFENTLLHKTAIYRTIMNEKLTEGTNTAIWSAILDGAPPTTDNLYAAYAQQPHSQYSAPNNRFGMFGYDHYVDRKAVKLHIDNPTRGESPLSPEHIRERHAEFKAMLTEIYHAHPEVTTFLTGSWVYSTSKFRNLLPPNVVTKDLMSPDMFFGGNSLWGQFINKGGELNERISQQFLERLERADTPEKLVDAFPYGIIFTEAAIERYYEYYGVETKQPDTEDFTMPFYGNLIDTVREGYTLRTFSEVSELFLDGPAHDPDTKIGLIRHDIDISPQRAEALARIEQELGVRATYFAIPNIPAYNIASPNVIASLRRIASLGHEVGLHYNATNDLRERGSLDDLEESIAADARQLEDTLELPVRSFSFHYPGGQQSWLRGPLVLGGLVNAYAGVLMAPENGALYATDSTGAWRYGNPIERVRRASPSTRAVQILTHAEWWPTDPNDTIES